MAVSRNHHFIPQCYLRMFAQGRSRQAKVYCCDLRERKAFTTLVRNVGARRDFNKVEAEGHGPDALESAYSKFEGPLSEALKRTEKNQSLAEGDLSYVLNLMALLATRHPRMRSSIQDFLGRVYRMRAQLLTASKERYESAFHRAKDDGFIRKSISDVSYESARDFVSKGNYSVKVHQNKLIELELEGMDAVLKTMALRKWSVLKSYDAKSSFVTSDHPVCLMPLEASEAPFSGPGYGMRNTSVLFPLTSNLALVGLYDSEPQVRILNELEVANFNTAIIQFAQRQVYSLNSRFVYSKDGRILRGSELHLDPEENRE